MSEENTFHPDYAIHPGEMLREWRMANNVLISEIADATGIEKQEIWDILYHGADITPYLADKLVALGHYDAETLLAIQKSYDEFQSKGNDE